MLSVNDNEVKMSFHTLQELNLDAARYRWARENVRRISFWVSNGMPLEKEFLDQFIDQELGRDA